MQPSAAQLPPLSDLYRQHRSRALAVARRILGDADEAEDLVQDVFSRLCLRKFSFDGRAAYSTWLHRIMVNSSINWLRSRRRRKTLELYPQASPNPEEQAIGQQRKEFFVEALSELTEQHQQVLWLREMRGFSYPEIATLLNVPEGTVKSALNRGRTKVLDELERLGALE